MVKHLFLKDGHYSVDPIADARPVAVKLPAHYTLTYDGCGRRFLRHGHGEVMQVLTGNDHGRPVPEMVDRWGNRTRLQLVYA